MGVVKMSCLPRSRKECRHSVFVLVITLFVLSSVHAITWTKRPTDPTFGVLSENVTLEWDYTLQERDTFDYFLMTKREKSGKYEKVLKYGSDGKEIVYMAYKGRFALAKNAAPAFMLIKAEENDETEYCCEINSKEGDTDTKCVQLEIAVRTNITAISRNQTVNETNDVTLLCNTTGKPMPNVTWTIRGNKEWKHPGSALTLRNISRDQHGEYWCTAKNPVSNATASVTVTVNYAPSITLPQKRNVTKGDDIELYCANDGRPSPIVTWSKIGGPNNRVYPPGQWLNITNANRTGTYMCMATNGIGKEATATIEVNVLYPPSIDRKPINRTLNETQDLRLKCYATGNPNPLITWTKVPDKTPMDSADGVLTINNVNKTHSGVYQCRASNGIGSDALASSTVIVNYKPVGTSLTSDDQNNAVITGHSVTFSCTADGLPPPELKLRFNNSSLDFFTNGTFTLPHVNSSNHGTYECVPRNFLGTGPTGTLKLTVQVPPSIDYVSHDTTVNETDNVTIFCNASGNPTPTITWTFLEDYASMEPVTLKTLLLASVNRNQTGRYRCTAANGVRIPDSADVLVTINYKPGIKGGASKEIISWMNHETELTCEAEGVPAPEIIWSRDGAVTSSVQLHSRITTLKFTPKQASDFGFVACTAKNMLGLAKMNVTVKQLHVPDTPEILQIHRGFNNLEIHWKESNTSLKYPIFSYMVQVKEKDESQDWLNCTEITHQTSSMMCVMDELKSNTEYIVRVSARNVVGYSEFTVKEVSTKERTVKKEKQQGQSETPVDWIIGGSIGAVCVLVIVVAIAMARRFRGRVELPTERRSLEIPLSTFQNRLDMRNSKKVTVTSYDNPTMKKSPQTDMSE